MDEPLTVDSEFIQARTAEVVLDGGLAIRVRPIVPGDRDALGAGIGQLSQQSRFARFFRGVDHLSDRDLIYLTEIDYFDHFAWVAMTVESPLQGLGVARYIRLEGGTGTAEASVVVIDAYQRKGVATVLLELLAQSAIENGVDTFRGYALASNRPVIESVFRSGGTLQDAPDKDLVQFDVPLPPTTGVRDSTMYSILQAAARGEVRIDAD